MTYINKKSNRTRQQSYTKFNNSLLDNIVSDKQSCITSVRFFIIRGTQGHHRSSKRFTSSYIAEKTGYNQRSVQRALKKLQEDGEITKVGKEFHFNYFIDKQGRLIQKEPTHLNPKNQPECPQKDTTFLAKKTTNMSRFSEMNPYIKKESSNIKKEKLKKEKSEIGETPKPPIVSLPKRKKIQRTPKPSEHLPYSPEQYQQALSLMKLVIALVGIQFTQQQFFWQMRSLLKLIVFSGKSPKFIASALKWAQRSRNSWYRKVNTRSGTKTYKQLCKLLIDFQKVYDEEGNRLWFRQNYAHAKFAENYKFVLMKSGVYPDKDGRKLDEVIPFKASTFQAEIKRWEGVFREETNSVESLQGIKNKGIELENKQWYQQNYGFDKRIIGCVTFESSHDKVSVFSNGNLISEITYASDDFKKIIQEAPENYSSIVESHEVCHENTKTNTDLTSFHSDLVAKFKFLGGVL